MPIGWLGRAEVLVVDAASYLVAFVLVAGFVPGGSSRPGAEDLRGMLAGVRVLLGDRLLRAFLMSVSLSQMGFQTLLIALPVLAFTHGQDPEVAGLLVGAWVAGCWWVAWPRCGPAGSRRSPWPAWPGWAGPPAVAAGRPPLAPGRGHRARAGRPGQRDPGPPLRAVALLRIPPGLRVQAMTAESTLSTAAGLLALALANRALEALGTTPVLGGVGAVATTAAVGFAAVAMRLLTRTKSLLLKKGPSVQSVQWDSREPTVALEAERETTACEVA